MSFLDADLTPIWNLFKKYSSLRVVYALAEILEICRAAPPRPILPLPDAAKREIAQTLCGMSTALTDKFRPL